MKPTQTIFAILFFLTSVPLRAETWELVQKRENVLLWKFKKNPKIMGTLQSKKRQKALEWNSVKSKKVFENVAETKRRTLSLIGITNWSADNYSWNKRGKHHELIIEGTYTDPQTKKISFREHHLFFPRETYQIVIVSPAGEQQSREIFNDFVQRAEDTIPTSITR